MATDFWSPVRLSLEIAFVSGILVVVFGLFLGKVMATQVFGQKADVMLMVVWPTIEEFYQIEA